MLALISELFLGCQSLSLDNSGCCLKKRETTGVWGLIHWWGRSSGDDLRTIVHRCSFSMAEVIPSSFKRLKQVSFACAYAVTLLMGTTALGGCEVACPPEAPVIHFIALSFHYYRFHFFLLNHWEDWIPRVCLLSTCSLIVPCSKITK